MDCTARGPAFEGAVCEASMCSIATAWSCLSQARPVVSTAGSFTAAFLVRETVSQAPKVGVSVRACRRLDVSCAEGLTAAATTDSMGNVSLGVPGGFAGYARLEEPSIMPTLFFFDPPVQRDLAVRTISVHSPETAGGLAALAGAESNSSLGIVLVTVFDCFGKPAEGVRVTPDNAGNAAKTFYIRNGLPAPAATATDATGYSGVVNAAPGTVSFSASLGDMYVGSVTMLVQAGTQTIAHIVPNGT